MDPADFYSGIVVDAYTRLKSSSFDPAPYLSFVRTHGQPALEIGCGDGEPLLDLCAAGLDVDGVDSSLDMVERCRERAAARSLSPRVFHQRVETMHLGRRYASIYLAGPTFNLLADDETAARALTAVRGHLTDGGAALVPLWVPGPTSDSELGVTRDAVDDAGVELRYTPVSEIYDEHLRTRTTRCRYERVTTGVVETAEREWVIHWHTPESVRRLCASAGLEVVDLVDDDSDQPASSTSTSFTLVARRPR